MRTSTWLFVLALGSTALAPAAAQKTEEEEKNFVPILFDAIFGPHWSLSIHGGYNTFGNFLLQSTVAGERVLKGAGSVSYGAGAGFDLEPSMVVRLNYNYTRADLEFRDDNGTGSSALDVDAIGKVASHVASVEIMRSFLPTRAAVTPYASAGFAGVWWILDPTTASVDAPGGTQQFRFGATASFGLQFRLSGALFTRLEMTTTSSGNPFTGDRSYRAQGGFTLDEPSRVGRNEYRLAAVYFFGQPLTEEDEKLTTARRSASR